MLIDSYNSIFKQHVSLDDIELYTVPDVKMSITNAYGNERAYIVQLQLPEMFTSQTLDLMITVPLGMASSFWTVGARNSGTNLPADWAGEILTSLVNSAPMGCLLDSNDKCLLGFAYSDGRSEIQMRYGVDEEYGRFTIVMTIHRLSNVNELMITNAHEQLISVTGLLSSWMMRKDLPFPMTTKAYNPVFSTWYAYLQEVDEEGLINEAGKSHDMGCDSLFIDDGWQSRALGRGYRGCGDWIPDDSKFRNLKNSVAKFAQNGLKTVLWVAPLLLGEDSKIFPQLKPYAPIYNGGLGQDMYILDPRHKVVRDFVVQTCDRLYNEYRVDGLKIDFVDVANQYQNHPLTFSEDGDVNDVGEAMELLLQAVKTALLKDSSRIPIIEFRQPYSSPAIAAYSNVVRACDCPADAITNRTRIADERMVSLQRAIHGDMLLWDTAGTPEACAEQIMSSFFAVPQISVRPTKMSTGQFDTCRFLLRLWKENSETILKGSFQPEGQAINYPLLKSTLNNREVIAVYSSGFLAEVDLQKTNEIVALNATHSSRLAVHLLGYSASARILVESYRCDGSKISSMQLRDLCSPDGETEQTLFLDVPAFGVLKIAVNE
jgi:alpha-galactosidase